MHLPLQSHHLTVVLIKLLQLLSNEISNLSLQLSRPIPSGPQVNLQLGHRSHSSGDLGLMLVNGPTRCLEVLIILLNDLLEKYGYLLGVDQNDIEVFSFGA